MGAGRTRGMRERGRIVWVFLVLFVAFTSGRTIVCTSCDDCEDSCTCWWGTPVYGNDCGLSASGLTASCTCDHVPLSLLITSITITIYLVSLACCGLLYLFLRCNLPTEDSKPLMGDDGFFVYRAKVSGCFTFVGDAISYLTMGLALPWVIINRVNAFLARFVFSGRSPTFIGTPFDYMMKVCIVNSVLGCLTLGLWNFCGCSKSREDKWIDSFIVPKAEDQDYFHDSSVYLYRADQSCCDKILSNVCMCLSCGLLAPCLFVAKVKTIIEQTHVFGRKAVFRGTSEEYCSEVFFPTCIWTTLSCGLYACCGCAAQREKEWVDVHIFPVNKPTRNTSLQAFDHFS